MYIAIGHDLASARAKSGDACTTSRGGITLLDLVNGGQSALQTLRHVHQMAEASPNTRMECRALWFRGGTAGQDRFAESYYYDLSSGGRVTIQWVARTPGVTHRHNRHGVRDGDRVAVQRSHDGGALVCCER